MNTQSSPIQLENTHWHKSDVARWNQLIDFIPNIIESNLKLWQLRIDRARDHKETPFTQHETLFTIQAVHYAKRADGVFAPDGEQLHFLVCADSNRDASAKVKAQLTAHGFMPDDWILFSNSAPLILA